MGCGLTDEELLEELGRRLNLASFPNSFLKLLVECCNVSYGFVFLVIWLHGSVHFYQIVESLREKYSERQVARCLKRLKQFGLIREKESGVWELTSEVS